MLSKFVTMMVVQGCCQSTLSHERKMNASLKNKGFICARIFAYQRMSSFWESSFLDCGEAKPSR
ncbi:MAG: hypothetical protein JWP69_52 [Flaviaesturariibacter sp.]|nr:hypothetical protein [Flaviaesturariibacter sp.]